VTKIFKNHFDLEAYAQEISNNKDNDDYDLDKTLKVAVSKFLGFVKSFSKAKSKNEYKKMSALSLEMAEFVEAHLSLEGIKLMAGDSSHYFAGTFVQGFREGDADGGDVLVGNSSGKLRNKNAFGPMTELFENLKINQSDFYSHWLIGNL